MAAHKKFEMSVERRPAVPEMCEKHDEKKNYFCKSCNESICGACCRKSVHKGHDIWLTEEEVAERSKDVSGVLAILSRKDGSAKSVHDTMMRAMMTTASCSSKKTDDDDAHVNPYTKVIAVIDTYVSTMCEVVHEHGKKLIQQVSEQEKAHIDATEHALTDAGCYLSLSADAASRCRELLSSSNDWTFISRYTSVHEQAVKAMEMSLSITQSEPPLFTYATRERMESAAASCFSYAAGVLSCVPVPIPQVGQREVLAPARKTPQPDTDTEPDKGMQLVPCPHALCTIRVKPDLLEAHVAQCTNVECQYKKYGCKYHARADMMMMHERDCVYCAIIHCCDEYEQKAIARNKEEARLKKEDTLPKAAETAKQAAATEAAKQGAAEDERKRIFKPNPNATLSADGPALYKVPILCDLVVFQSLLSASRAA